MEHIEITQTIENKLDREASEFRSKRERELYIESIISRLNTDDLREIPTYLLKIISKSIVER